MCVKYPFSNEAQVFQWGQAVLEHGARLASVLARSLERHRTSVLEALEDEYRNHTAPEAEPKPTLEELVQERMERWLAEDEDRKDYPTTLTEWRTQLGRTPNEAVALSEQLTSYNEAQDAARAQALADLEGTESTDLSRSRNARTLDLEDDLLRLQEADAVLYLAGMGARKWLVMDDEATLRVRDPPTLTNAAWKVVFKRSTNQRFQFVYNLGLRAATPQAWILMLSVEVREQALEKQGRKGAETPVPLAPKRAQGKTPKPSSHSSSSSHMTKTQKSQWDMGQPDRFLNNIKRHGMGDKDFTVYRSLKSQEKIPWLIDHAKQKGTVHPTVVAGYEKALREQQGPSQSKFGRDTSTPTSARSSPRSTASVDYSAQGQRKKHEGGSYMVEMEDDPLGMYDRPNTPKPHLTLDLFSTERE